MSSYPLPECAEQYILEHMDELKALLKTLTLIPSPSNQENRRAEFCRQWLEQQGCQGTYIDSACNVIYPYKCTPEKKIVAFLAHSDTVFPDQEITWEQEGDIVHAMGVGDDTAGVAVVMMLARYVTLENVDSPYGLLFVADSGEEGLGNLRGSRQIIEDFGDRMYNFIGFDSGMTHCQINSVGSHRYEITVTTEGGQSYGNYGNRNAIQYASAMINTLYQMKVPQEAKTTQNVGMISGGISVNTIAGACKFQYEFRSADRNCLQRMENMFLSVAEAYRAMEIDVDVKVLAIRPCRGDVNVEEQQKLLDRCMTIIRRYHGDGEVWMDTNSTDANIPWSRGIPSTTLGVIKCGNAHTRNEWADLSSLNEGMHIALNLVLSYANP